MSYSYEPLEEESVWISPETVHVCRGKSRRTQLCDRCFSPIYPGEKYTRRVFRQPPHKELVALYEHYHPEDCPEEFGWGDEIFEPVVTTTTIHLVTEMVAVEAIDVTGNTFTEWKPVLKTVLEHQHIQESSDDEEILF